MKNYVGLFCISIAAIFYMQLSNAEPFTLDDEFKPYQIILEEIEDGNGSQLGLAEGTLASEPQHLFVKGLSSLRAAQVTLIPLTEGSSFKLEVTKNNWESVLLSCEAKAGESCYIDFKTFDGAGFKVTGSSGDSWLLALATSPELSTSAILPSPLYEAKKTDADQLAAAANRSGQSASEANSPMLKIIIALLAIIATLLFFFVFKRNSGRVGVLLLFVLGVVPEGDADPLPMLPPTPVISLSDFPKQGSIAPVPREIMEFYERSSPRNSSNSSMGGSSPPREAGVEMHESVMNEIGNLNNRIAAFKSMRKLVDSYNDLSSCSSMSNPPGAPRIPTFCEGDENCSQCYEKASEEFNFVRGIFEQLRVVYKCTKSFSDDAIAFGDNVSGLHAVSGLAWQSARKGIQESVTKLQQSYDRKYAELSNSLQNSMMAMNSCEAEWGEPDWYDRFGYMYFEFITDKYKRSD